ncbi:hypothetical protein [Rhizobium sp.]|uniref:hypothetical protein n=1 Tax=Rhizobium sp. TaxID=391 RepID=UPI0028AA25CF
MTALEEIKKAEHERIWLEPAGATVRCWCQDNQWGDEGVEYVLASTLESLQRENEEKSAWIKAATVEITKAIGGGSEMFTKHGNDFRVDPAFVATYIQFRRERHAESKKASIQKERELIARAERAEAELKRLEEWKPISEADKSIVHIFDVAGLSIANSLPIWARDEDGRVYEALWSDNGKKAYWWDIEGESPVDPVEFMPHPLARTALASTGGEHHAE